MSIIDVISDYSNKNLDKVPEEVLEMFNLKMLYLEGNLIEALPDDFFEKLKRITWLDLRKNRLKSLPSGIGNHEFLETLLLQDNQLEALPNELGLMPSLKVLQLSGNPLMYPNVEVIESGIQSICSFLKDQHASAASIQQVSEDDEESEIRAIDPDPKPKTRRKARSKPSVKDLLRKSSLASSLYSLQPPMIDVKSLNRTESKDEATCKHKRPNSAKKVHKIAKDSSKVMLHSVSYWNKPKNLDQAAAEKELNEIWLKRLKDLLADQEKILQQEKNLKALNKWRLSKKMELPRCSRDTIRQLPPFDTDPDFDKMLSREDLTKQIDAMIKKNKLNNKRNLQLTRSKSKNDIQKLINDVVAQMKRMEVHHVDEVKSPRTEQAIADREIKKILALQKKIVTLQAVNNTL